MSSATAIVSPNCRIRYPKHFVVGDHSIVDDFCYFSTRIEIGRRSHIAPGVTIAGGPERQFRMGDFSSIASGTRIYCSSNDYVNDLVMIEPPGLTIGADPITGDVILGNYTGIGANTVVMPGNTIPEGTVIGALSFVPANFKFEPWSVYFGIPVRYAMPRNRDKIMRQVAVLDGGRRS